MARPRAQDFVRGQSRAALERGPRVAETHENCQFTFEDSRGHFWNSYLKFNQCENCEKLGSAYQTFFLCSQTHILFDAVDILFDDIALTDGARRTQALNISSAVRPTIWFLGCQGSGHTTCCIFSRNLYIAWLCNMSFNTILSFDDHLQNRYYCGLYEAGEGLKLYEPIHSHRSAHTFRICRIVERGKTLSHPIPQRPVAGSLKRP